MSNGKISILCPLQFLVNWTHLRISREKRLFVLFFGVQMRPYNRQKKEGVKGVREVSWVKSSPESLSRRIRIIPIVLNPISQLFVHFVRLINFLFTWRKACFIVNVDPIILTAFGFLLVASQLARPFSNSLTDPSNTSMLYRADKRGD